MLALLVLSFFLFCYSGKAESSRIITIDLDNASADELILAMQNIKNEIELRVNNAAESPETQSVEHILIPDDALEFNGHFYKVFDLKMSWNEAKEYCENIGGHLATISSSEENNYLIGVSGKKNVYWIGMKLNGTNNCYWITGESVEFTNFHRGEPDNYQGKQGHCVLIVKSSGTGWRTGEWSDMEPEGESWDGDKFWSDNGFICEWDSMNPENKSRMPAYDDYVIENSAKKTAEDNPDNGDLVNKYENEILFRNIPWGTSMADIEKMKMFDFFYTYDASMPFEDSFKTVPDYRSFTGKTEYNTGIFALGAVYGDGLKVGGYIVSDINVYCAYGMENGKLNRDEDSSRLFAADYEFDPIDYKATYYNLQGKLNTLYGEGKTSSEKADSYFMVDKGTFDYTQVAETTIWDGANDTHVILVGTWIENESQYEKDVNDMTRNLVKNLYITYYQGGMDEQLRIINKLEQELERMKEVQNAEGADGL